MFPDPARLASSWSAVPETVSMPLPGSSAVNVRALTPSTLIVPLPISLAAVEGWHCHLDAQREVVGEASALGDDEDAIPDVGLDVVDQVVVCVDDDGLLGSYVNGDPAAAGQVDCRERWEGSRLSGGDA